MTVLRLTEMYVGHQLQLTNQIKVWTIANLYTKYNRKTRVNHLCWGERERGDWYIVR